jgi:transcriptional repressor NrdR
VQKRDGRYEAFDRRKLLAGMEKASEKRPISRAVLERACERIIRELTEEYGDEFPSVAIGEKVMEKLRAIDEVAFVRFASVYRKFRDIREFVSEIESLKPYDRVLSGAAQPNLVE